MGEEHKRKRHADAVESSDTAIIPAADHAAAAAPWHPDITVAPSGRPLRDVRAWRASGVELSSDSDKSARLLDMAAEQILGVFGDPYACAVAAMQADPNCAVPPCVLLWLRLLGSSGKRSERDAVDLMERAECALQTRAHTARECALVGAMRLLAAGDLTRTLHIVERCLAYAPTDVMLLKFHNDICLFGGFSRQMRDAIFRCLPAMDDKKTPMFSYVLGMQAFALEETGDTKSAITVAQAALDAFPQDTWALHALLHALDSEGRATEAMQVLHRSEDTWSGSNLKCHLAWHWGLCYLELGHMCKAMSLYDERLAPFLRRFGVFSLIDCTQFLLRIELLGGVCEDVEDWSAARIAERWEPVTLFAMELVTHHRHSFTDAHVGVAAAASADTHVWSLALRECASLSGSPTPEEDECAVTARRVGATVCAPLTCACMAWRCGMHREALDVLLSVRYQIHEIGGSIAQRDLWNLLVIRVAIDCAGGSGEGNQELGEALLKNSDIRRLSAEAGEGLEYYVTLAWQLCAERCANAAQRGCSSLLSSRLLSEAQKLRVL